jgi:hypothetical protein
MTDQTSQEVTNEVKEPVASVLLDESATPVVEPAKVEPAKVDEAAVVEYEPTGDVGLDMALAFVAKAGLGAEHPAMKAAMEGDFTILKATLAQKGAVGWEQMIALGEAAFERTKAAEATKAAELQKLVHDTAGGAEEWALVQKWAGENATPEEKQQINGLLQQGGLAAKGAVNYLIAAYNKAGNVVREPIDGTANAGRGGAGAGNGPLGPKEYAAAVGQLNAKLGGRLEGTKEYADLQRRRAAYRG